MPKQQSQSASHHQQSSVPLPVLWTQAQPAVAAYITSLVPDFHDAQDLLQQTAMRVFARFELYDPQRSFVAWSIGVARNEVLNHWRSRSRDRHVFTSNHLDALARAFESIEGELDPMREALSVCVEKLREPQRRMLELRYDRELSPSQIGRRLGMTSNAVFVALHRVRAALRTCVKRRLGRPGMSA